MQYPQVMMQPQPHMMPGFFPNAVNQNIPMMMVPMAAAPTPHPQMNPFAQMPLKRFNGTSKQGKK